MQLEIGKYYRYWSTNARAMYYGILTTESDSDLYAFSGYMLCDNKDFLDFAVDADDHPYFYLRKTNVAKVIEITKEEYELVRTLYG